MAGFEFGTKVVDNVTGFTGIVTGRAEYMHGVPQCLVETLNEGKPLERWFANDRLMEAKAASMA